MHKRMTRILSALSLLAVIPAVAFASPGRVAGMNVPGDYIKDYTGIYTYVHLLRHCPCDRCAERRRQENR